MKREEIDNLLQRSQRLIEQGLAELEKSQAIIQHSRMVAANAVAVREQYLIVKYQHHKIRITQASRTNLSDRSKCLHFKALSPQHLLTSLFLLVAGITSALKCR